MLIIFGFRVRMKTLETLVFFCPGCGGDRQGMRQVARRWFTLFFIPVIPLNVVGEVVKCGQCSRTYRPEVLERPTTATLGETLNNAIRALTVMIVAVGDRSSTPLRAKAVETVGSVAPGYTDDTLESDMAAIDPALAAQYVQPLAEGLAPTGAERFLSDLVRVAFAGGSVTDGQRRVIDEAGRTLGLSPAYVVGIVASVTGTAPGPSSAGPPSPDDRISQVPPPDGTPGHFVPPFEEQTTAVDAGANPDAAPIPGPGLWAPPEPSGPPTTASGTDADVNAPSEGDGA